VIYYNQNEGNSEQRTESEELDPGFFKYIFYDVWAEVLTKGEMTYVNAQS